MKILNNTADTGTFFVNNYTFTPPKVPVLLQILSGAASPTRPSLTEREPAALSLSCSSPESEEPPLPVELAPEEEVVKEPEAVGPEAGMVPLV